MTQMVLTGGSGKLGGDPVPVTEGAFGRELAPYLAGRGTVRFPLDKTIPYDLIERLVALLVQQRG
jgi:uncharacterized protein YdhG (YjbR/CyaY superfamily)